MYAIHCFPWNDRFTWLILREYSSLNNDSLSISHSSKWKWYFMKKRPILLTMQKITQVLCLEIINVLWCASEFLLISQQKVLVTQPCPALCDPKNCSLPGSSVHGILQASILKWVAILFSRGSSHRRDWTWVSYTAGRFFIIWATREAQNVSIYKTLSGFS